MNTRGWVLVLMVLASGCARGLKPVQPGIDKRGFLELTTPYFRLVTDLDRRAAIHRIQELERSWWAIVDVYELLLPTRPIPPELPLQVLHFRDCDFLRAAIPEGSRETILSYHIRSVDFQQDPVVVSCDRKGEETRQLLNYQVVLLIQTHLFSAMPPWLEHGIAGFLEAIQIGETELTLGKRSRLGVDYWGQHWRLTPIERLRAMTPNEFYSYNSSNHFGAWVAVHLLFTKSEEYRERFRKLLAGVATGLSTDEAWARSFGDLPVMPLQREYVDYVERPNLKSFVVPYRARPRVTPVVRELRAGEAHAAWLQLLVWGGEWLGEEPALAQLELAAKADPTWSGLPLWRAIVSATMLRDEGADPTPDLRAAAEADPTSTAPRLALIGLALSRRVPKEHLGVEPRAPEGLEELEPDVRALARTARTAAELTMVARYFALRRLPQPALAFAQRAATEYPACAECHDVLGLVYFQLGRHQEAIAEGERALGRALLRTARGETVDPIFEKRLQHYRASAR